MRKSQSKATRAFYASVGKRIAEARQGRKMTQDALAAAINLSRTSVVNIEHGKQQILLHTFSQLTRVLEATPEQLLPDLIVGSQPILKAISLVENRKLRLSMEKELNRARVKSS